jgi:hypothetical protein
MSAQSPGIPMGRGTYEYVRHNVLRMAGAQRGAIA